MDTTKIALTERFTAFELSQMFNIDCNPDCDYRQGLRVRYIDEPYAFNDCKVPLLINRKRKLSKRVRPMFDDNLKAGISEYEPGTKGRLADLVAFYADNAEAEISPFEGDDDE
jgi:hypothetical protein